MSGEYMPRVVDSYLEDRLRRQAAVVVKGPKYSGKTRTAENLCRSALYLSDANIRSYVETAGQTGSRSFLDGEYPRLIDEWQVVPEIWDHVRFAVDHDPGCRFVLTGSSTPPEDRILHPGTGRFSNVTMRTMSLYESGESSGEVSMRSLFDGEAGGSSTDLDFDGIIAAICRGGWPAAVASGEGPGLAARDYLDSLVEWDMPRVMRRGDTGQDVPGKGLETVRTVASRMLRSIARNVSTAAPVSRILGDVNSVSDLVSAPTFARYLEGLDRMYVTENLEAWNPHMRSRTRLRTKPKWHLCDPSLAVAALDSSTGRLATDIEMAGLLFESMCLRDIRVYLQPLGGRTYYVADDNGYEVDVIAELSDGRWGAFEVKLGSSEFDAAASNLLKLRDKVDTSRAGGPAFLAILTGVQHGYTRPDGVSVVPVGSLGP